MTTLSDRDRQILALETLWWQYTGAKEQAIRERFGMSTTEFYQHVNRIINLPEAMAYDPILVKRLQDRRSSRKRST